MSELTRFSGLLLVAGLLLCDSPACAESENRIRNGSFEGSLLYWHNTEQCEIVANGKVGKYAMRVDGGWTLSAPMILERDSVYAISLWARTVEGQGSVQVGMPPMAREVAQKAKRIWNQEATQSASITNQWQRYSFTFRTDVKTTGFWPNPHYGVFLGKQKASPAYLVDGVTVTKGTDGTAEYLARQAIEVLAKPMNLPGWEGNKGNIYEKGATARLDGFLCNTTGTTQELTARWQLIDYEGSKTLSAPIDVRVTLQPGDTQRVPVVLPLEPTGTVIARFSALDAGGETIDSSDVPLTSLPYPKNATGPDYRERFGGSFAGNESCLAKMQRIGFGWTRWWPRGKWQSFQPEPDRFDWNDSAFEAAFRRGISCHLVLYGTPEWAMDRGNPLPKDMQWTGDDPRWDDYTIETSWDRYVKTAVDHFREKPVVFQIANEPGHVKAWHAIKEAYVKFNLRTARLIKMTDPNAKVSINNVYANPSPPNAALLASGQLQDFDVWSWHDYHAGWLLQADGVRRLRQRLDEAGGEHLEIWFTEGWAYTNTLVDQPLACTHLTSVESTHATVNSMAEMAASGHDKVVMFHLLYETHGQSFWDYSGPGVMLWDWYQFPMPTLSAWNSLNHHIGISEAMGMVRPRGVNLCVFQDLRNDRGAIIAYADRNAESDVAVELPIGGLRAEDIMGNPVTIEDGCLLLSRTGRAVILYSVDGTTGQSLFAALEPLDRKHLGFVTAGSDGRKIYRLPETWRGNEKGASSGNPVLSDGKAVWRVDGLYPSDPIMPENYTPMVWGNEIWIASKGTQGGHPSAKLQDGVLILGAMGPWGGDTYGFKKQGSLSFIVPDDGVYRIQASIQSKPWSDQTKTAYVYVMKRDEQRVGVVEKLELPGDGTPVALDAEIDAARGHEIVFLAEMPHWNNGTTIRLSSLTVTGN